MPIKQLEQLAAKNFSHVLNFFKRDGFLSIADLHKSFKQGRPEISKSLRYHIYNEINRLYGKNLADTALNDLKGESFYLAHHGGIENHPHLIASSICAIGTAAKALNKHTHIAFVCNNIKKENSTVPCGFLSGRINSCNHRAALMFEGKKKNKLKCLYALSPLSSYKFKNKINKSALFPYEKQIVNSIDIDKRDMPFTDGCALENSAAMQNFLPPELSVEPLYVDYDVICKNCLLDSLSDKNSFTYHFFNDKEKFIKLISSFCAKQNYWDPVLISNNKKNLTAKERIDAKGTVLFYEITPSGSLFPLNLVIDGNSLYLQGVNCEIPISAKSISSALIDGKIAANNFMSYIPMIIDHGMHPVGGIYMHKSLKTELEVTTEVFHPAMTFLQNEKISALTLPIAVTVSGEEGLNFSHPLSSLDLRKFKLSSADLDKLLLSKINDSAIFTYTDVIIDNFNRKIIDENIDVLIRGKHILPPICFNAEA